MSRGLFTGGPSGGAAPLPTEQERCDRIQAEARAANRPLFRPPPARPAPLAPTRDLIDQRLSEELAYMRRIIGAVGETLANDGPVVMRHGSTLQQFDLVEQVLFHLATVLGSDDRVAAIDRIGMESLKGRLLRRAL